MEFKSRYVSKDTDEKGYAQYTDEENGVWKTLFKRQQQVIQNRACDEHIQGIEALKLNENEIPQLPDVNEKLLQLTGWSVFPVKALISHQEFFSLLASRRFPAATFIRVPEDIDYIQEPDIFHELYGHCPMLTHQPFAEFVEAYAKKVLSMPKEDWPLMQRLFWFTVEFGLIQTVKGVRAYGGGILSSIGETPYSLESDIPQRLLFHPVTVFRMPYRIDMMQKTYFIIESFEQLYQVIEDELEPFLKRTRELGEFPPLFPVDKDNPGIHISCC